MATDIESAFRALQQILTTAALGSDALPDQVRRNASLRDVFGQITGSSLAYLNLIDDDPVLYDTIIGPAGVYQDEFGQRGVVELIIAEIDDDIRDATFAEALAVVTSALRSARSLPMLSAMNILAPEKANLAAGPLPGIKAARVTFEFPVTAPDMLGNILADRVTTTIEPITMSSELEINRGSMLVGLLDPIVAASQLKSLIDAQLATGIEPILNGSSAAVRLAASSAIGVADILGAGDGDLIVGITGAGIVGDILGSGDASVPQPGGSGFFSLEPILGAGDAAVEIAGAMGGVIDAIVGSGAVFTNPGANANAWLDPVLASGDTALLITAQSGGVLDDIVGSGGVAVLAEASGGGDVEAILSSGQAGQPQLVLSGNGIVEPIIATSGAQLLVSLQSAPQIEPILGTGDAGLLVDGTIGGQIDPIVASIAGTLSITANAGALVDPIVSASVASVALQASSSGQVDPILGSGDASSAVVADGGGIVEQIISAADADVQIAAASGGILDAILGSGDAALLVQASSGGVIDSILGSGDAAVAGASNEPETDAFIARMNTAPTTGVEAALNSLIAQLKTDGIWAKLDALFLMGLPGAADGLLNVVQNAYNLTGSAGVDHVPNTGYRANTTSSAAITGSSAAAGTNWTDDSAHWGVKVKHDDSGNQSIFYETSDSAFFDLYIPSDGTFFYAIGGTFNQSSTSLSNTAHEHIVLSADRSGPSVGTIYLNGAADAGSPALTPSDMGHTSTPLILETDTAQPEISVLHWGGYLTAAEVANLDTALDAWFASAQAGFP
jgi:hypothetical protein